MTETCQCCNGTGRAPAEPDPVAELRRWCQEHGHRVDPLDRVDERTAADVLGVTPGHLRNRRCYFDAVEHVRVGNRILYTLDALARQLEA